MKYLDEANSWRQTVEYKLLWVGAWEGKGDPLLYGSVFLLGEMN